MIIETPIPVQRLIRHAIISKAFISFAEWPNAEISALAAEEVKEIENVLSDVKSGLGLRLEAYA